ncbi:hypothetical protein [Streptomyces sp. NPDC058092]|uniref:hypothetical protein n=1 Tax=Streptomyces sp. NPDC058092 TaxID=3346336 RepID=UPI0036EC0BA1
MLRAAREEAGRDPKALQVFSYAIHPSRGKRDHYAEPGVEEVVAQLPSGDEGELLRALDAPAEFL